MAVALVVFTAIAALVNGNRFAAPGVNAALAAGLLVAVGMFAALWISNLAQRDRQAIHYGLAAQLVRLAFPLIGAIALERLNPALAEARFFGCVLGIYLPALLVETWLAVRMISPTNPSEVRHG
ncbi:MAG: hypothetical protein SGJ19_27145 [Planctomycetia bacterium]|nr:hypothetical protein [Planctomycetia bacterium]